ncbi:MAG TPA: hypothetical protein VIA63_09405 [Candidatus Limnocylindria bacterium]|jgi:hypothetical protein
MTERRDDGFLDEARLRRALRLDAAELPPRIDLAALVARAEDDRPARVLAYFTSAAVAVVAATGLIGLAVVALPAVAPAVAAEIFAFSLDLLSRAAVPASALLQIAEQPSVPLAATFALAVAVAYEYLERRERVRVTSS